MDFPSWLFEFSHFPMRDVFKYLYALDPESAERFFLHTQEKAFSTKPIFRCCDNESRIVIVGTLGDLEMWDLDWVEDDLFSFGCCPDHYFAAGPLGEAIRRGIRRYHRYMNDLIAEVEKVMGACD